MMREVGYTLFFRDISAPLTMKEMDAHQIDETILAFGINQLFGEILYFLTILASFVSKWTLCSQSVVCSSATRCQDGRAAWNSYYEEVRRAESPRKTSKRTTL